MGKFIESIPEDLWDDWCRFAAEPHVITDVTEWISMKAMEFEFDFFELTMFLNIVVSKARLKAPPPEPMGRGN